MEKQPATAKQRILAVDALRGFAVMGIILLHNIEHFNFYSFPDDTGTLKALNTTLWDFLFFSFSGKAYAIFALLFGFTFFLQSRSAEKRGEDFRNRYMWRLVLLLGFGFVNSLFFPGEILVLYALLGFVLVPVRHWSDRALMILAIILMLQPVEWLKVIYACCVPEANPQQMVFSLGDVYPQLGGTSWWEMVKANFVTGQLASLNWAWCYGRVFQTASLFMIGLWIGRKGYFSSSSDVALDRSRHFWSLVLCLSLPLAVVMYYAKSFVFSQVEQPFLLTTLRTILNSWYNLFFMLTLVGAFLMLYWVNEGKVQRILAPYGQMSLTDYVMQSVIGSFLYFGYGLGLHRVCGTTYSLLIGIVFFLAQLAFAHWWFRHYKRGPLESLWHKLTWL
ncbi:MAG: DUF418 domain-containing protein [Clostridiales bacterium]|nr:DUF418 domain-containing protein [Clostridiales bacterium]